MRKETVLILEWAKLPQEIKNYFREYLSFNNDCLMPVLGEFAPSGDETWADSLTFEKIEEYHKDQRANGLYDSENLDDFIKDYGLEFEVWFIAQNIDLTGIKTVLVEMYW